MTIRETVREAQELTTKLGCGSTGWVGMGPDWRNFLIRIHPIQYPQSLGELCIELAQDRLLKIRRTQDGIPVVVKDGIAWYEPPIPIVRDIQELRQAMYHRNGMIQGANG